MTFLIELLSKIWRWLSGNIITISEVLVAVFAGIEVLIQLTTKKTIKEARKRLKREEKNIYNCLKQEPILYGFQGGAPKEHFFFPSISIKRSENDKRVPIESVRHKDGACIITGEAGSGKSSLIKHLYIKEYWINRLFKRRLISYINAELVHTRLGFGNESSFYTNIRDANIRELVLYLDGIDEAVSPEALSEFLPHLRNIMSCVEHFRVYVSCRTKYSKLLSKELMFPCSCFEIEAWNDKQLSEFIKALINYEQIDNSKSELLNKFFSEENTLRKTQKSPLLAKMLLFVKLCDMSYSLDDRRFDFYLGFLKRIVLNYQRQKNQPNSFSAVLEKYSKQAFSLFNDSTSQISLEQMPELRPILVRNLGDGGLRFVHETFFEFLVAYYIGGQIKKSSVDVVKIISRDYTNSISDFITESLLSGDSQVLIRDNLISIYSLMLSNKETRHFKNAFKEEIQKSSVIRLKRQFINEINRLSDEQFFSCKYMIAFRLGRLGLSDETVKSFFSSVFEKDDYVTRAEKPDPILYESRKTVLWRECAISASFIGEEAIELGYINKMLDYNEQYNKLYDLINRTHTLLYYGDLALPEDGIINLQDAEDDGNIDCQKACLKRIARLSMLNDCNKNIIDMEPKEKRIFYFRAFDIATLYFIKSRDSIAKLSWLGDKERNTIKDFKTDFLGISERKRMALEEIKEKTIEAINALS